MNKKDVPYILLTIALVALAYLAVVNSVTQAQDVAPTTLWEYREIAFSAPASLGSPIGPTFFVNGNPTEPSNPDAPAVNALNSMGRQGWELVAVTNNQFFIFKRPLQE